MIGNSFLKIVSIMIRRLFRWIVFPAFVFMVLYYTGSSFFSEMMTRSYEFHDMDQAATYGMTPSEYKEVRFMEIEEYLRELRYYDGPLTGKITFSLIAAIGKFERDQKIPSDDPFLSQVLYLKLRAMYWLALGVWPDPDVSFFYADDKRIVAHGGWENLPSRKLVAYDSSNIWCVFEEGFCTEVEKFDFRDFADMPLSYLGTQTLSVSALLIKYRITKNDKGQIIAEMVPFGADLRVENMEKLLWTAYAEDNNVYLNIDIPSHTILKTIVLKKTSNLGTNSDEIRYERKLIDPAEGLFEKKYENMRKQRVMNNADGARYDRLLQWMQLRDLREYKKQRDQKKNNFLLFAFPDNQNFTFLGAGD